MRIMIAVLLALPLYAAAPSGEVALGIGATDSNRIVVRIDGKETTVTLAGVKGGSEPAATFASCLIEKRVVRIKGPRSAATVSLLDGTSVASHIAEFLSTSTSTDPCTLGKAAYQQQTPSVAAKALPAVKLKKPTAAAPAKEGHVSFGSGKLDPLSVPVSQQPVAAPATAPMAPKPVPRPAYQPAPVEDAHEPVAPPPPPPPQTR